VRDAAGELADCLHLLRLAQMLLGLEQAGLGGPALGDVAAFRQQHDDAAFRVADRLHDLRGQRRGTAPTTRELRCQSIEPRKYSHAAEQSAGERYHAQK